MATLRINKSDTVDDEPKANGWPKFRFSIDFGNVITVFVVIVSVIWAWAKLDSRIGSIEDWRTQEVPVMAKQIQVFDQMQRTLDLLQQRLGDYPLHKHIGNTIVYPGNEPNSELPRR